MVSLLSETTGTECPVTGSRSLSGGSINQAWLLQTPEGNFFMKYNRADAYPGMFEQEARGLQLLRGADEIRVPAVIGHGDDGTNSFIILEYLDSAPRTGSFYEDFGRRLAQLHRHTAEKFGLDHDNYIGSLKQYNDECDRWTDFFRDKRLGVQMELAARSGLLPSATRNAFERLFGKMEDIFPEEPPSLVHGDLWGGNYMVDEKGEACIIDPAVYYGFREMDLGMSKLFGGFSPAFYQAYNDTWPMEPGWQERVDICNLYPLMVHVNLFGSGYLGSVEAILRRF